ncbi:MAG: MBOAT family protein [Oscillospiraceae bacterium]|nr:MBOAT family protein [Oscillospiraceae bacterium]
MVFSELTFLYFFLPIVILLHFAAGNTKIRNVIVLLTGLIFYAWGEPFYVLIMLFSTAIDYTAGRLMAKYDDDQKKRRICLIVSVCMNVGLLAVFKYSDFIFDSINSAFHCSLQNPVLAVNKGLNKLLPLGLNEKRVELPIGISFYTFQSMSYTIDLYLRNITVQKSFLNFASYVSLFPQIVAGPIVRYEEVSKELEARRVNVMKISSGIGLFVKGLAKKVLLANRAGLIWAEIKGADFAANYATLSVLGAWLGIIAFAFQIYFDFSGYSDMAMGLGKMMGFDFPKNFDHPYISRSVSEFWRRWHITLGSWFRSYVYIPLGGNRKGKGRTFLNLLIVWGLTGLWHGASWNFLLWGLYFGILIIIERAGGSKLLEKLPHALSALWTFILVLFGWVLFDTDTLGDAVRYITAMFGAGGAFIDDTVKYLLISNALLLAVCTVISVGLGQKLLERITKRRPAFAEIAAIPVKIGILLICTAYLVNSEYNPFLYFRF